MGNHHVVPAAVAADDDDELASDRTRAQAPQNPTGPECPPNLFRDASVHFEDASSNPFLPKKLGNNGLYLNQ